MLLRSLDHSTFQGDKVTHSDLGLGNGSQVKEARSYTLYSNPALTKPVLGGAEQGAEGQVIRRQHSIPCDKDDFCTDLPRDTGSKGAWQSRAQQMPP